MITFASSNKKKNNMDEKSKIPTPVISLIPLFVLVALLAMVIPIFGGDALLGGSQVSLLIASSVCVGIAMIKYNYKWSSLEEGMAKNIKKVTPAIIILLLIGAISGTWMLSGVVPTTGYTRSHLRYSWHLAVSSAPSFPSLPGALGQPSPPSAWPCSE